MMKLDARIKLAKMGAGEKVHIGWLVLNDNGTVHHTATDCNTYPGRTKAQLIGDINSIDQVTCPKCRKGVERRLAN